MKIIYGGGEGNATRRIFLKRNRLEMRNEDSSD
jgi:hypothetical protein